MLLSNTFLTLLPIQTPLTSKWGLVQANRSQHTHKTLQDATFMEKLARALQNVSLLKKKPTKTKGIFTLNKMFTEHYTMINIYYLLAI